MNDALTKKHYIFLLLWWLTMTFSLAYNRVLPGILFIGGFFLFSTFKIFKRMILVTILIGIATAIFPPLLAMVTALSLVFMLLKIRFLIQNWRALAVGIYTYVVYLAVIVFNSFFFNLIVIKIAKFIMKNFFSESAVVQYGSPAVNIASGIFVLALTLILHRMLKKLYSKGYTVERAFEVMGLTPLFLIAIILPFLKLKVGGHEIFSGSLSDSVGDIDYNIDSDINSDSLPSSDTISPAAQASATAAAAHGTFAISGGKDFKIREENGTTETVTYIDEKNAVIKDSRGRKLGTVTLDKRKSREIFKFVNGTVRVVDLRTGAIASALDGKILGKMTEGGDGTRLVTGVDPA